MSEHFAEIYWERAESERFLDKKYSRAHTWTFDGGAKVPASSSPHSVPIPMSVAANVDPEEAFVAAISSCHMLWFLFFAANKGYVINSYRDHAVGIMAKNAEGKLVITEVTLKPEVIFNGPDSPDKTQINELHERAHENCNIAHSVKTFIKIEVV